MNPQATVVTKKFVDAPAGRIAYVERGAGPVALFVHGVFLNGHLWRDSLEQLSDVRRCIAVDLLAHGATEARAGVDLSFAGQAEMLRQLLDALGIDRVDLVANDSGGGIAQIFAATHRDRIRSLVLTNCDTHDNWPPEAFVPTVAAAASGQLTAMLPAMVANLDLARGALGVGFEDPSQLSDESLRIYLEPFATSPERAADLVRFFEAMDCRQTVAVEADLARLEAPTLLVWGTGDVFFDIEWAHWLARTIPGATRVVELPGAKLFFPQERSAELIAELRKHWEAS